MTMKIDVEILKKEFGSPFLPKGFIKVTEQEDKTLLLEIGDRDVHIDRDGSTILGAGTAVLTGSKWSISKK